MPGLKDSIIEEKAVDYVLENAVLKEVAKEAVKEKE